jgi:hypothetical protein
LKPKKCHFAVQEVNYLDHAIAPQGVHPQREKGECHPQGSYSNHSPSTLTVSWYD